MALPMISQSRLFSLSLSWKSTFLCCLMNENANQNKNWEMIISQAKAINMAAAARAERCEEILPPQSKLFPSFSLTLCSLSIEWKLLHLNLCCRLGFSHMHSHFCYHFHSELRAQIHSHSQFLSLRRHWKRLFVFFGGFISTQLASSQSL